MTSLLRSAVQFASLDRKMRRLNRTDRGAWRSVMASLVTPGLVEFELRRNRLEGSPELGSGRVGDGLRRVLDFPTVQASELGVSDLMALHALLVERETPALRVSPPEATQDREIIAPNMIPGALERLLEWIHSEAFAQMHPVEQMTLCQMRLSEIVPFEVCSAVSGDLFSFLTLEIGTGLLPSYASADVDGFQEALSEALSFATKSLVELNTKACERTCDGLARLL
jgi:hypothetical protein